MKIGTESKFLKINGKPVSSFQDYSVQLESLADQNSGRTDDGMMHINWVLRVMRKVNVKLPPLSTEDLGKILEQVQGQEYDLTYLDPIKGVHTIHCYTSNSSADCMHGFLYGGLWTGAAFNAIEMGGEK